jgi:hypothetical protein
MKFNKLYNLIEGIFEPAGEEEMINRRKEYIKTEEGLKDFLTNLVDEIIGGYPKIETNIPHEDWTIYIDIPSGAPYSPVSNLDIERFLLKMQDQLQEVDLEIYDDSLDNDILKIGIMTS